MSFSWGHFLRKLLRLLEEYNLMSDLLFYTDTFYIIRDLIPIENTTSAMIPDGMNADGLQTALMNLGMEEETAYFYAKEGALNINKLYNMQWSHLDVVERLAMQFDDVLDFATTFRYDNGFSDDIYDYGFVQERVRYDILKTGKQREIAQVMMDYFDFLKASEVSFLFTRLSITRDVTSAWNFRKFTATRMTKYSRLIGSMFSPFLTESLAEVLAMLCSFHNTCGDLCGTILRKWSSIAFPKLTQTCKWFYTLKLCLCV